MRPKTWIVTSALGMALWTTGVLLPGPPMSSGTTLADITLAPSHTSAAVVVHTAPIPPGTVVDLEGDSTTDGGVIPDVDNRLAAQLSEILRVDPSLIIDNGIGGQMLTGPPPNLASRWSAHLAALPVGSTVVLNIGMNDLFDYPDDATFTTAYTSLVVQALNAGMRVIVTTITPISSAHWNVELLRQSVDGWIDAVFSDRVLDYAAALHDTAAGTSWAAPRNIMPDGIHPSEGGTRLIAQLIAARLRTS